MERGKESPSWWVRGCILIRGVTKGLKLGNGQTVKKGD